jgi:hypothetical protein
VSYLRRKPKQQKVKWACPLCGTPFTLPTSYMRLELDPAGAIGEIAIDTNPLRQHLADEHGTDLDDLLGSEESA